MQPLWFYGNISHFVGVEHRSLKIICFYLTKYLLSQTVLLRLVVLLAYNELQRV